MSLRARVARSLRALRLQKNLSQAALARRSGLSVSYVSMLERGQRAPTLGTLEALATALGISPLRLLGKGPR